MFHDFKPTYKSPLKPLKSLKRNSLENKRTVTIKT